MRAGVPQLILFWDMVHAVYGAAVKRLKVGTARRLSTATEETLVADLRTILAPEYAARARELATQMTEPAKSAAAAADLWKISPARGALADRHGGNEAPHSETHRRRSHAGRQRRKTAPRTNSRFW